MDQTTKPRENSIAYTQKMLTTSKDHPILVSDGKNYHVVGLTMKEKGYQHAQ